VIKLKIRKSYIIVKRKITLYLKNLPQKNHQKKKKPSIVESRYDPSMAELIDIIHMPSVYEEFVIYLSAKNKKTIIKSRVLETD